MKSEGTIVKAVAPSRTVVLVLLLFGSQPCWAWQEQFKGHLLRVVMDTQIATEHTSAMISLVSPEIHAKRLRGGQIPNSGDRESHGQRVVGGHQVYADTVAGTLIPLVRTWMAPEQTDISPEARQRQPRIVDAVMQNTWDDAELASSSTQPYPRLQVTRLLAHAVENAGMAIAEELAMYAQRFNADPRETPVFEFGQPENQTRASTAHAIAAHAHLRWASALAAMAKYSVSDMEVAGRLREIALQLEQTEATLEAAFRKATADIEPMYQWGDRAELLLQPGN